jgi:signal recognition particle receptor subunit alpha
MRKWDDSAVSAADMAALDFSAPASETAPVNTEGLVSANAIGQRKGDMYEVAEWDYRPQDLPTEDEILARVNTVPSDEVESTWTGLFSRISGSKVLTKQDLAPVLAEMERNLMDKNVAKDIAEKMCESVGAALVGQKLAGLTSMSTQRNALTRRQIQGTGRPLVIPHARPHAKDEHRHLARYSAQAFRRH